MIIIILNSWEGEIPNVVLPRLSKRLYSIKNLKKIHGVMTDKLIIESGELRKGNVVVFDENWKCILVPLPLRCFLSIWLKFETTLLLYYRNKLQ